MIWRDFFMQYSRDNNQTGVGAYRIRPDVGENETDTQTNTAQNSSEQV